ncbi:MAG: CRISPR-associated endonuclease Cas2 [Bacteroidales bacterium]|nr:CRISPR-associated endonuclease Cas2 [Bacteroidales bacterium]
MSIKTDRLNAYRIMWLFVYFDLPTQTKKDRKEYTRFRKSLIKDGFAMIQYSIYARHCASVENAEVHKKRVKAAIPPHGEVIIFLITDKQFGKMEFYRSAKASDKPDTPQQLELF